MSLLREALATLRYAAIVGLVLFLAGILAGAAWSVLEYGWCLMRWCGA